MPGRRAILRTAVLLVVIMLAGLVAINAWSPLWWQRLLYPLRYQEQIDRYARVNRLDPYTVTAVIYVESGFDPRSTSSAGARGLMQLLPGTAKEAAERLGDSNFDKAKLEDPATNIRYGTWYLRHLRDRYGSTAFALAAYNGGGANMDRWLRNTQGRSESEVIAKIPFRETREFVGRVKKTERTYRRLYPEAFK